MKASLSSARGRGNVIVVATEECCSDESLRMKHSEGGRGKKGESSSLTNVPNSPTTAAAAAAETDWRGSKRAPGADGSDETGRLATH